MAHVLVVEDQKKLLASLKKGLEQAGYAVTMAATGEEGYYAATTEQFDAIVLDLMLPGRDGLEVLRDLRCKGFTRPVLILTARDSVDDRVAGLDSGADDYLVKPFAFAELLARLRALLRREGAGREFVLRVDDLEMDLVARRVVRDGEEIELSQREFELLEYFVRHVDTVVTRDMLSRDVWKEPYGVLTNVIDVYVRLLLSSRKHRTGRPPRTNVPVHKFDRSPNALILAKFGGSFFVLFSFSTLHSSSYRSDSGISMAANEHSPKPIARKCSGRTASAACPLKLT